jgi:hypothetical protein
MSGLRLGLGFDLLVLFLGLVVSLVLPPRAMRFSLIRARFCALIILDSATRLSISFWSSYGPVLVLFGLG